MHWNTSTRSTRKSSTRSSISHSMLLALNMEAQREDYTLVMVAVMEEARIILMDIITIMDIIRDTVRDRGVEAVALILMVAIKGT